MKSKKGFTLIELLVVIAIIGILASVVLVSFPGATKKARDSRIVSAISQARTVMTYVYGNDGNYTNYSCTLPVDEMPPLCKEVADNHPTKGTNPTIVTCTTCATNGGPAACIYSLLNAKTNYWYCADSLGRAGFTSTNPGPTCGGASNTGTCPTDVTS